MRLVLINLAQAEVRRQRMREQLEALGLVAEFHEAIDGRCLGPEHYAQIDRDTRRRLGLWPQADGSIANWLSQRQVMQEIVDHGPEMVAIFEDDAGLSPQLPSVLAALESRPFDFDVIRMNRRSPKKTFIPSERLTSQHKAGRVRYSDYGSEGYVITRDAARRFLATTPKMMWEIDQALSRFWENGLNVFYVDPPVVFHNEKDDSQIENDRKRSRGKQRNTDGTAYVLWRREIAATNRKVRQRLAFRRLLRGMIGVTRWP